MSAEAKVVVVGSLSLDMVFQIPRRPLKGETVKGFSFETFVGGKGNNQALAAARAGAVTAMVGKVGKDSYGELILETLENNGVDISAMSSDPEAGSGLANIYVDPDGDNSIIIVPRANDQLAPADIDRAKPLLEKAKLLVLQLEIPMDTVIHAAELASESGLEVLLNPAPAPDDGELPEALYKKLDYLIPNESEAGLLLQRDINGVDAALEAARELKKRMKPGAVVLITLGEKGVVGIGPDDEEIKIAAYKVDSVDTTAAGDAFAGCLARGLTEGLALKDAVREACAAGALATTKPGAVPSLPTRVEILSLVQAGSGKNT